MQNGIWPESKYTEKSTRVSNWRNGGIIEEVCIEGEYISTVQFFIFLYFLWFLLLAKYLSDQIISCANLDSEDR